MPCAVKKLPTERSLQLCCYPNMFNQLVSATTQLKLAAADGKKYNTDILDSVGIVELAKNFPNNKATKFLDWFLYSDTSIDGQSKKKAYTPNWFAKYYSDKVEKK